MLSSKKKASAQKWLPLLGRCFSRFPAHSQKGSALESAFKESSLLTRSFSRCRSRRLGETAGRYMARDPPTARSFKSPRCSWSSARREENVLRRLLALPEVKSEAKNSVP